jgi:rhomboid protease GluP
MEMKSLKLKETYLSKFHFSHGLEISLGFIFLIILFSNLYWENWWGLSPYLSATPQKVFAQSEYWRIWTTTLIHADIQHMISNCLMLFLWGTLNTYYFGPFFYPLVSFFLNGLITLLVLFFQGKNITLLGSSGLIYFLGGHWISLYILIDKKSPFKRRIFRSIAVILILFLPTHFSPSISYLSHNLGLIGGLLYGILHYLLKKKAFIKNEIWVEEPEESDNNSLEDI